jgi:Cell wall-active antibiotics response 4TMS YvqF/Domain of unknown function (DUF1707)
MSKYQARMAQHHTPSIETSTPLTLAAQRLEVIERLSDEFSSGDMPVLEFESRVSAAHRAESSSELDALVVGFATPSPLAAKAEPAKKVSALFGSVERRGHWRPAERLSVSPRFGSVVLDFREALMRPGVTEVDISAVFGSVEIIVPPTLAVDVEGSAILGTFEHVDRVGAALREGAPVLRVRGRATFGSVEIETQPCARRRDVL